ncbi:hypothetical protein TOT_010000437 [Theileria orientalis strain Shintoku]|uniref:Uncharacterized protein n=1 Tax=Theileria orientalis strain Shintoku TaxID=869250 RepID=J4CC89_THEOR|nr:hypothetical protein TOT_010000437 [Theileria orientalis strain Shintoku]BAM38972.1 hypothetical protein TOT_010000437 [Theileria orientalis strain Shintoku]|eukprot:XP_009689273.1 hypothetical protein TOT_010000437 [Theileria orientalis strain Shintoku]
MIKIILTEISSYEGVVCVHRLYGQCRIIRECIHEIEDRPPGEDIEIYEKRGGNKLKLMQDGRYIGAQLSHVQVYANAYDEDNTPLVILLNFKSEVTKRPAPKFFKYSQLTSLIRWNESKRMSEICHFNGNQVHLFRTIMNENSKLSSALTYQMDITIGEYNGNKICVTNETSSLPALEMSGFRKYKHEPVNAHGQTNSCVMVDRETPLSSGKNPIGEVQGKKYSHICSYYYSEFAEAILLEFNSSEGTFYYTQRKNEKTQGWAKLDKVMAKMLLNEEIETNQIHSTLVSDSHRKLLLLLRTLVVVHKNTVVLPIDRQSRYGKDDVADAIKSSGSEICPNPECLTSQPENVYVKRENCPDLERAGYACYRSTLRPEGQGEGGVLRLLVPSESCQYSEIKLLGEYSGLDQEPLQQKSSELGPLAYLRKDFNLYVFFYGRDPRPLFFCCNGTGYRPLSSLEYAEYWVKMPEMFECPISADSSEKLVSVLSEIIGSLTIVDLSFRPAGGAALASEMANSQARKRFSHVAQPISNAPTIRVTLSNNSSYRKYIHRFCDMDGRADGYRLGFVKYCSSANANVEYDITKQLVSVDAYYNLHDCELIFPLMLVFHFKDGPSEYYRLVSGDPTIKKWRKIKRGEVDQELLKKIKDDDDIEGALEDISHALKISFTKAQGQSFLFNLLCSGGDGVNWVVMGASVGGVGVGAILGAYAGYLIFKHYADTPPVVQN